MDILREFLFVQVMRKRENRKKMARCFSIDFHYPDQFTLKCKVFKYTIFLRHNFNPGCQAYVKVVKFKIDVSFVFAVG